MPRANMKPADGPPTLSDSTSTGNGRRTSKRYVLTVTPTIGRPGSVGELFVPRHLGVYHLAPVCFLLEDSRERHVAHRLAVLVRNAQPRSNVVGPARGDKKIRAGGAQRRDRQHGYQQSNGEQVTNNVILG